MILSLSKQDGQYICAYVAGPKTREARGSLNQIIEKIIFAHKPFVEREEIISIIQINYPDAAKEL